MTRKAHLGSRFEDFLRADRRLEAASVVAVKRVLAWQLSKALEESGLPKSQLAERMGTSRAQLDRLLDPENPSVTLDTLARAAAALGKQLRIELAA
jgi:predicted XRE-type DNA-binding protein